MTEIFRLKETLVTNDHNSISEGSLFYKAKQGDERSLFVALHGDTRVIPLSNSLFDYVEDRVVLSDPLLSFSKTLC